MLCRLTSRLSVCFWILVDGNHATHSLHQASNQKKKMGKENTKENNKGSNENWGRLLFSPHPAAGLTAGCIMAILLIQQQMLRMFRKCQILSVIAVTARSTSFGYGCNSIMDPKSTKHTDIRGLIGCPIRLNSGGWEGRPLTFGWSTTDGEPHRPGRVSIDDSINIVATGLLLQAFYCFLPLHT